MLRAAFLGCALILPALFVSALPGSQISACSVQPGTAEDLGSIVRELGRTRTPFAIKGSGHNANPGFSDIALNEEEGTVEIGAGLTWADVYLYLVLKGLNVVGGRMDGVGVSGLTLGGGHSWKSNQYGLTIDTVTVFELVLPNGHVKKVTEEDENLRRNSSLTATSKGGLNNYGIVTKYTLKTHKQTDIWGAVLNFKGDQIEPAYTAFAKWLSVDHDPRAAQMGAITYSKGTVGFQLVLFYDGPAPPACLYGDVLNLPNSAESIIRGDFVKFVSSIAVPVRERAYGDGVPLLRYSAPVVKATIDNVKTLGDKLGEKDKDVLIIFNLDAFRSDIFTHGGPSAYPPVRPRTILPSSLLVAWNDEFLDKDEYVYDSDLKDAAHHTNFALYVTPLEKMYGKSVRRLREIKKKYDPFRVMDLTCGFRF
ncbi:FAD-binding domain-containing protein [Lactarius vividus]|nr:FAD-binding domain-containing protein [Lactarius vividus]